jgi:hypothetical protein
MPDKKCPAYLPSERHGTNEIHFRCMIISVRFACSPCATEPKSFPQREISFTKNHGKNVFCFLLSLVIETLNTADYCSAERYGGRFCILPHAFS